MTVDTVLSFYGFSLLILFIIFLQALKTMDRTNRQDRVFLWLMGATVIIIVFDMVSRFRDLANQWSIGPLSNVATFLLFAFHHIIALTWVLYIDTQLNFSPKRTKIIRYFVVSVMILQFLATILNLKYHFFYQINEAFEYARGPFYYIVTIVTFSILIAAYVLLFLNIKHVEKKYVVPLVAFAAPPVAGVILQFIFVGSSFMLPGVIISIFILFLRIQTRSIYTDYLTGANNRKRLDRYLNERISYANDKKTFSGILLDVNNFKNFNDTFGHDLGDIVLQEAVDVLKSALRTNDFVARYGGDEFCIILDISNQKDLEKAVQRIRDKVMLYNQVNTHDFELSFSMGYAVYDGSHKLRCDEFIKILDQKMYLDKKNK